MNRTGLTIASLALAGFVCLSTGAAAQPVLTADDAVKMALQRNSQVVGANAGVLNARGGVYNAYSGVLPHLTAGLSRSGSQTKNQSGTQIFGGQSSLPAGTPEYDSYSTSPTVSGTWAVLDLSSISGLASARASLKGAQWSLRATRSDVALATRQQFYQVVQAVKLIGVTTNALQLARDSERRVRTLFEVGSVSRNDVLQAQVQTAQSQLDSIAATQSLLVQRDLLATQIGVEEAKMGEVDTVLTFTPRDYDEAALLREAAEKRPDLKAARANLQAAQSNLTSARLGWLPYVTLSGSATYNPFSSSKSFVLDSLGVLQPLTAKSEADRQYSGRVAVNWDFFDGGATSGRNAIARSNLAVAKNAYEVLQRNLAGEVHEAALTYQQVLASEAVAQAGVASATESMKLTQQKYNVGSATILDLITAQVALERAHSQLVNALSAIRVAEARIDRVRGQGE